MKTKNRMTAKSVTEITGLVNKNYAAKIADIYNMLNPASDWVIEYTKVEEEIESEKIYVVKFKVTHPTGSYSFTVPEKIALNFYTLFGISTDSEQKKGEIINVSQDVSAFIKKARKFSGKDPYRSALDGILIEIEGGKLSVIATDSYILYKSKAVNCDTKKQHSLHINGGFENLGPVESIEVFEHGVNMGGKSFHFVDTKFPNYKAVIPEYSGEMVVDPKKLINTLKPLKAVQNKYTHGISMYLNGNIQIKAEDLDWSNEAKVWMPYVSKTFKDCEIGFNSKFLLSSLSVFKDKTIKIKTEGEPSKPVVLQGENEIVLCMPHLLKK